MVTHDINSTLRMQTWDCCTLEGNLGYKVRLSQTEAMTRPGETGKVCLPSMRTEV